MPCPFLGQVCNVIHLATDTVLHVLDIVSHQLVVEVHAEVQEHMFLHRPHGCEHETHNKCDTPLLTVRPLLTLSWCSLVHGSGFYVSKEGASQGAGRYRPCMVSRKGEGRGTPGGGAGAIKVKGKGGNNAHVTDLHRLLLFNW